MKRQLVSFMILAVTVLACSLHLSGGVITHTATYDTDNLTVGTATLGGVTYSTVSYASLYNSGEPGTPWLPIEYLKFSVPYNAVNFSVSASTTRYDLQVLSYPVYPSQADIFSVTPPDSAIYASSGTYPATVAWVIDEDMMASENHIVTVAVMPVACLLQNGNRHERNGCRTDARRNDRAKRNLRSRSRDDRICRNNGFD